MQENQSLTLTLLASLIIHGLLAMTVVWFPEPPPSQSQSGPIEIEIKGSSKSLVMPPKENPTSDPVEQLREKVALLADAARRFKEEMVAENIGDTKNSTPRKSAPVKKSTPRESEPGLYEKGRKLQEMAKEDLGDRLEYTGESALRQYIPGVKRGGFTALNTDQFIHYTFYARANEQILNRWLLNLRGFAEYLRNTNTLHTITHKNHVTQVEVLLNPEGELVETRLLRSSGVKGFDEAVIEAFVQATPINNPPEEMVEDDGLIHLRYEFYVIVDPRRLAKGS